MILNLIILIITFNSRNFFFLFFVGFELSLIPIIIMILVWGTTPERLTASSYLLIYTLIFSIPFLILIILIIKKRMQLKFRNFQKSFKIFGVGEY